MQPDQDLELEHELFRVPARLGQEAPPAPQGHVIRPTLEEDRLEVPGQPLAKPREVLGHQLLLQRVGVGRDDDPLAVSHRARDGWDQVREAFAGAGSCLDHERPAAGLDLGDGEQHLHLRLAVLVTGQQVRERAFRPEQAGDHCRVVRRGFGPPAPRRLQAHGGFRHGTWVRRGQRVREEVGNRPLVRRDQGQHRLFQPLP